MTSDYRKSDFKLGSIHGKNPTDKCREAQLRNYLFGAGNLVIVKSADNKIAIRLVGYEIPIWARGKSRDECIDLLGYDDTHRPWVIELKQASSSEKLVEVIDQVNRYAKAFDEGIRDAVQCELRQRFLWPDFQFTAEACKMILAHRSFFSKQKEDHVAGDDILLCSFARYEDESSLLSGPRTNVLLKIERPRLFHRS